MNSLVQKISLTVVLSLFFMSLQAKPKCDKAVATISTENGKVCGIQQENSDQVADAYLGIPFAKPPVESLRWKNPQSLDSYDGVYPATEVGNNCVQPTGESGKQYTGSEDCLYLNVWKPVGNIEKLPVMVFIPGGGFAVGSGGLQIYNGAYLAAKHNVVVVTINYRLGSLGFLRYKNGDTNIEGNFGIKDQIMALKWVKKNISNFGGDSKKSYIIWRKCRSNVSWSSPNVYT